MKSKALIALVMIAGLALQGCHKSAAPNSTGQVRFLHASIDTEPLDVLVDTNAVTTALAVTVTTPYQDVNSGTHTTQLRSNTNGAILLSKDVAYTGGVGQLLAIYGHRSGLQVAVFADDTTDPLVSGNFKVRALGLAPDSGVVDVYITANDINAVPPNLVNVGFASATDYIELAPGSMKVTFTTAGTKDVLFQSTTINFAAGSKQSIGVFPSTGGKLVNAVQEIGGSGSNVGSTYLPNANARAKVVNADPTSTGVNFLAGTTTLLSNVPYKGASSYVNTLAGSTVFSIQASNVPGVPVATLPQTLAPAGDTTVLVMNNGTQPRLLALADNNALPTAGFARIRFVNAHATIASADVLVNFAATASGVASGTASVYSQLTAGDYTVTFATPGGVSVIAQQDIATLATGGVYTAYLYGTGSTGEVRLVRVR